MKELKFASEIEAMQYLADYTGKRVKIAVEDKEEKLRKRIQRVSEQAQKLMAKKDKLGEEVEKIQAAMKRAGIDELENLSVDDYPNDVVGTMMA